MGGKKVCRLRFEKKSKNFIQKIYFKGSNFLNDLRVLMPSTRSRPKVFFKLETFAFHW
jgi:hypothetical protein